jgi:hypothetical protein
LSIPKTIGFSAWRNRFWRDEISSLAKLRGFSARAIKLVYQSRREHAFDLRQAEHLMQPPSRC